MDERSIAVSCLAFALFLATTLAVPSVSAQGSYENINENFVSENEFLKWKENVSATLEDLGQALRSLKDNAVTKSELESAIGSLSSDLSNQISELSESVEELKEKKKGKSLMLVAYGEQMKFLTFGGFGGKMNPMMLMAMSGGGGLSSMFKKKKVSTDTPIMIMNDRMEMVPNAEISAYTRGENGVTRMKIPTAQGITFFPVEGRVFGSVSAPNYEESSFFVQVGEASAKKAKGAKVEWNSSGELEVGTPVVISATVGGEPASGTVKVEDPDADNPDYRKFEGSGGSVSMVPGSESFRVKLMREGKEVDSTTMYTSGYGGGGGGGGGIPWVAIGVAIVLVGCGFGYFYWRKRKSRGIRKT